MYDSMGPFTCTSALTLTGVSLGDTEKSTAHTFTVTAKDAAGNKDPTPDAFTWNRQRLGSVPGSVDGQYKGSFTVEEDHCNGWTPLYYLKWTVTLSGPLHWDYPEVNYVPGQLRPTGTWQVSYANIDSPVGTCVIDRNEQYNGPAKGLESNNPVGVSEPYVTGYVRTTTTSMLGSLLVRNPVPNEQSISGGIGNSPATIQKGPDGEVIQITSKGNYDRSDFSRVQDIGNWDISVGPDPLPDTAITGFFDENNMPVAPGGTTSTGVFSFYFEGFSGAGWECSLDGSAFVDCSASMEEVSAGTHTVKVRNIDSQGNKDNTPASFTWKVSPLQLSVTSDPTEINPYPVNANPPPPVSKITLTAKHADGSILSKGTRIELKACTQSFGTTGTGDESQVKDGHKHDNVNPDPNQCFQSSRPRSTLEWRTEKGNPITLITDGISDKIDITYFSPKITYGVNNRPYYISGEDKIIATLVSDNTVKHDTHKITTKVSGLQQMFGTTSCPGGGGTFFFGSQTNHGCIFWGTQQANDALVRIANSYVAKQQDCIYYIIAHPNPATRSNNPAVNPCLINHETSPGVVIQNYQLQLAGNPLAMKITAMSLPWGGVHDISGNWSPPHASHNDGKNVDIGFNGFNYREYVSPGVHDRTSDHLRLLRYVIKNDPLFQGWGIPTAHNEGDNMSVCNPGVVTCNHFHVIFRDTPNPGGQAYCSTYNKRYTYNRCK